MEFDLRLIAFGALGGVIAELVRLVKDRPNISNELTSFNTYASMSILAIIGAFAVAVFGAATIKEAAAIGIAAPVLLSSLAAKVDPPHSGRHASETDFWPQSGVGESSFIESMRRRWAR